MVDAIKVTHFTGDAAPYKTSAGEDKARIRIDGLIEKLRGRFSFACESWYDTLLRKIGLGREVKLYTTDDGKHKRYEYFSPESVRKRLDMSKEDFKLYAKEHQGDFTALVQKKIAEARELPAPMAKKEIDVGDKAPDFEMPATGGKTVRLSDYLGKKVVVLYFYPKDETKICTAEACSFRDKYEDFREAGAEVIGVSDDSVQSHENFAKKHRLKFTLGSDTDGFIRQQYGIKKTLGVIPGRETFVIDKNGIVRQRFASQLDYEGHVKKAIDLIKTL